jgi:5-formyltetrahydrofolate cyclo-ligase
VPGLAFTRDGHRLGRGKGYYDKFLTSHQQLINRPVTTIALAFREQIYAEIPTSEQDFVIDIVLFDDETG